MSNLFDAMFAVHSVAHMEYHGEREIIAYSDGNVTTSFYGIVEPFKTVYRVSDDGHRLQVRTTTIIFSKHAFVINVFDSTFDSTFRWSQSGYGGVQTPWLTGVFTIDGENWIVDLENELGIQSTSGSYHKIALKSVHGRGRGYAGIESRQ